MKVYSRICENCHCCLLRQHPDVNLARIGWLKCGVCGFCLKIEDAQGRTD